MAKKFLPKLSLRQLEKTVRKGAGLMPSRPYRDRSKYKRKNKHKKTDD
jgi:hypothetical protein